MPCENVLSVATINLISWMLNPFLVLCSAAGRALKRNKNMWGDHELQFLRCTASFKIRERRRLSLSQPGPLTFKSAAASASLTFCREQYYLLEQENCTHKNREDNCSRNLIIAIYPNGAFSKFLRLIFLPKQVRNIKIKETRSYLLRFTVKLCHNLKFDQQIFRDQPIPGKSRNLQIFRSV